MSFFEKSGFLNLLLISFSKSGTLLGHFEIVSSLGAGGMGEVYRARDSRLGREVAIKLLLSDVAAIERVREVRDQLSRYNQQYTYTGIVRAASDARVRIRTYDPWPCQSGPEDRGRSGHPRAVRR